MNKITLSPEAETQIIIQSAVYREATELWRERKCEHKGYYEAMHYAAEKACDAMRVIDILKFHLSENILWEK